MSRNVLSSRFGPLAAGLIALTVTSTTSQAQGQPSGAIISGTVDQITLDNPNDVWSGGQMIIGGQVVIIPRNLILQLPAAWITLQQLHTDAPPAALAAGVTGLATMDGLGPAAIATVHGNRSPFGNVIAGDVFIEKGVEVVNGTVTYIDHTDGYLRIDGIVGDPLTGEMVRINDPTSRYTIQQGLGCDGGPNCSADPRFGVDPDNYTITFTTGYPAGIPSSVPVGQRPGFRAGDSATAAADANGVGDPFCPQTNRTQSPVPDSTRFAPIRVGDSITAEGNFEYVGGVRFLSAHTLSVFASLVTIDSPDQPDYMIFDEVEWDAPAFDNQRQRLLLIGFTTLNASAVDIFSLQVNRANNENNEIPLASTVGNPDTVNQGIVGGTGGIFKIRYDVDFIQGARAGDSPCENLANAGLPTPCSSLLGTNSENLQIMLPLSREIQGRTRRTLNPGVITRDINGLEATNGQYLTPIGVGFPEFVEIDLAALQTPFSFDGLAWNNDRRLGPAGCVGACENTPQPLTPFPVSNRDPGTLLPAGARQRMLGVFPFTGQTVQFPPAQPPALPITVTPIPPKVGLLPAPPIADFGSSGAGGTVPVTITFSNTSSGGAAAAQLWDFGDGTFSIEANPTHTFTTAGSFDVSLTVLNGGGTSTVTRNAAVVTQDPNGGANPPAASFNVDATAGNSPLTVNFTDTSVGEVTSWQWTFGDGSTSTLQNPSHTYTVAGLYTVAMTATGPGGSNTSVRSDLISVNEPGGLSVDFVSIDPTAGAAPLRVRFRAINVTGVATSGVFDFGDGSIGQVGAGNGRIAHTYSVPGTYTVTLTATDGTNTDVVQKVDFVTVQ